MMKFEPITLEGDIIRLVPIHTDHAVGLAKVATPDIFTYHYSPPDYTERGFHKQINIVKQRPDWLVFAIILISTGQPIGATGYLYINAVNRRVEIGYSWIAKIHQRTMVNPESKYLLLKHAFEDQHALRVQLKTDSRNLQSQHAIKKLGAVYEGVLRKHMIMPDGHVRDSVMYSITDDEWHDVKAKLQQRLSH